MLEDDTEKRWDIFEASGAIADYLEYKRSAGSCKGEERNACPDSEGTRGVRAQRG